MSRISSLALAFTAVAVALALPASATAQDWDASGFQLYIGSSDGDHGRPDWVGTYDNPYGYRQNGWAEHERWEHWQHEQAEARQRYFEQQRQEQERWYDGYGREREEDDE